MKNILLPTDFSKNSRNAISYAMELFKNELCTFYVLNVQKATGYTTDDLIVSPANRSIHQTVTSQSKEKLKMVIEALEKETIGENYSFHPLTDYDVFTDAIKQTVTSKNIDLIVMGTNGATGAKEVIFGSNTVNVIRYVECPILVIPQEYVFATPKKILYTLDDNDHFSTEGIIPLTDLLIKFKASLKILKIKEDDTITVSEFDDKKQMNHFFKDVNHTFHMITNVPITLAIDSFVQIMGVDLNALYVHKETFLDRFFQRSDTSKLSYGTRVPLLILRK
ncbi:universal stress protein [Aquimarina addita]